MNRTTAWVRCKHAAAERARVDPPPAISHPTSSRFAGGGDAVHHSIHGNPGCERLRRTVESGGARALADFVFHDRLYDPKIFVCFVPNCGLWLARRDSW